MSLFLKALGFFLLSTVKFTVSALPISMTFPYYQALFISISGGIFGVFFFMFLWDKVLKTWQFIFYKDKEHSKEKPLVINRRRRRIVKIKKDYGYWGIVATTPSVLSIPLGVFILMTYFPNTKRKFIHLSLSVVVWGFLLISIFSLV